MPLPSASVALSSGVSIRVPVFVGPHIDSLAISWGVTVSVSPPSIASSFVCTVGSR
jgi:hypothetical protein